MHPSPEPLSEKFALGEKINRLKEVQKEIEFQLVALSKSDLSKAIDAKIPGLGLILQRMYDLGDAVESVGERASQERDSTLGYDAGSGFHIASLVLAAFDFVRIPLTYLFNRRVPLTLNRKLSWAYSALLLALTITVFVVPFAAPIIGFIVCGLGFVSSMFLLAKVIRERMQLKRDYKNISKEISFEQERLAAMQEEAKYLEEQLPKAQREQHLIDLSLESALLIERYNAQRKLLAGLKEKQLHIQQELGAVDVSRIVYKALFFALACLSVIGLVVAAFFPPAGLAILTAAAAIATACVLVRISTALFRAFANWLSEKQAPVAKVEDSDHIENKPLLEESEREIETNKELSQEQILHQTNHHDSTAEALLGLSEVGEYHAIPPISPEEYQVAEVGKSFHQLFRPEKELSPQDKIKRVNKVGAEDDEGDGEGPREVM
jgi:hypothetical protein